MTYPNTPSGPDDNPYQHKDGDVDPHGQQPTGSPYGGQPQEPYAGQGHQGAQPPYQPGYPQPGMAPGHQGGMQPGGPQQPYPGSPYPGQAPHPQYGGFYPDNALGGWALGLGLAAFVLSCGFLTGIPAIIVGNKAKRAVAEGRANNRGLATAGIVLGWVATALSVLGIIAFIAWIGAVGTVSMQAGMV